MSTLLSDKISSPKKKKKNKSPLSETYSKFMNHQNIKLSPTITVKPKKLGEIKINVIKSPEIHKIEKKNPCKRRRVIKNGVLDEKAVLENKKCEEKVKEEEKVEEDKVKEEKVKEEKVKKEKVKEEKVEEDKVKEDKVKEKVKKGKLKSKRKKKSNRKRMTFQRKKKVKNAKKEMAKANKMSDEFIKEVSERYIELYELITGDKFVKSDVSDVLKRVEDNIVTAIREEI